MSGLLVFLDGEGFRFQCVLAFFVAVGWLVGWLGEFLPSE